MHARIASFFLLSCVLAGCPRPALDFGPNGRPDTAAPLLAALDARRAKTVRCAGDARVDLSGPQGAAGLDLYVVAEAPARLRIEAVSFFGTPVAVLVSDGVTVRLHDLQSGRFLETPMGEDGALVSRLLPVPVSVGALVSLLLGAPEAIASETPPALALDEKAGTFDVTLTHAPWTQHLTFDPRTWRPLAALLDDGAGHGHAESLDDWKGDADLPARVRVRSLDGSVSADFRWKTRDLETVAEPSTWVLEPPADVTPETP